MIKKIADYIIETSRNETTTGNYCLYFDEIAANMDGVTAEYIAANYEEIKDEIDTRPEILSETWPELENDIIVGFDVNLGLAYCPNAEF